MDYDTYDRRRIAAHEAAHAAVAHSLGVPGVATIDRHVAPGVDTWKGVFTHGRSDCSDLISVAGFVGEIMLDPFCSEFSPDAIFASWRANTRVISGDVTDCPDPVFSACSVPPAAARFRINAFVPSEADLVNIPGDWDARWLLLDRAVQILTDRLEMLAWFAAGLVQFGAMHTDALDRFHYRSADADPYKAWMVEPAEDRGEPIGMPAVSAPPAYRRRSAPVPVPVPAIV
jgi:hypothetical protein